MPWQKRLIPKQAQLQSGNYYWVVERKWTIEAAGKNVDCEIHVTVIGKDIDKTGVFKEFHVKFDHKSGKERIFFFFNGTDKPSLMSSKTTQEAYAVKEFKVSKGDYSEMKAKAIGVAQHAALAFQHE